MDSVRVDRRMGPDGYGCRADHVQRPRRVRNQPDAVVKSIGLALAVGVLIDAFIVRMTWFRPSAGPA
jgi:hypothetical protein